LKARLGRRAFFLPADINYVLPAAAERRRASQRLFDRKKG